MRYYLTSIIGDGTEDNAYRPDIPERQLQRWDVVAMAVTQENIPIHNVALVAVSQYSERNGPEVSTGFDLIDAIPTNLAFPDNLNSLASSGFKTSIISKLGSKLGNFSASTTNREILGAAKLLLRNP